MYIDIVPNRNSPPAVLLRESYRVGKQTKKRTLANLSMLPPEAIEVLRRALRGETLVPAGEALEIERSQPHGHVAAVLGMVRKLGLEKLLAARPCRERDLAVAMIVARVIDPGSKLATARGLGAETAFHTLAGELGLEAAGVAELYAAMDRLRERQAWIEAKLAERELIDGTLVLYDVSSTYFEGRTCPLAKHGYSRDGKKGKLQIVFGLLCTAAGCPVAVEVFPGNTADPGTLASAVQKVRERFGLKRIVLVADRGLLTEARIEAELAPLQGRLDWITALRAPAIRTLVETGDLQLSFFDERDLAEITSARFPGERLIACRNPLLAAERARKREALLARTQKELEAIAQATQRVSRPLQGTEAIALRVGEVLGRSLVAKHFRTEIAENAFRYARDEESIAREAALDGIYVIRTSVAAAEITAQDAVGAYKSLSTVERAFRSTKTVDLEVRPIHHRNEPRVRAHVFLCMLAYYVEWHLRQALRPLLFEDHEKATAQRQARSVVARAERSDAAKRKAKTRRTEEGLPVHSFQTLLKDLATLTKNRVRVGGSATFEQLARPTPLQQRALDLLGVPLR
jgi:hypothetical protein